MKTCDTCGGSEIIIERIGVLVRTGPCPSCHAAEADDHPGAR